MRIVPEVRRVITGGDARCLYHDLPTEADREIFGHVKIGAQEFDDRDFLM